MKRYEVIIVSKEYRTVEVDADSKEEASDLVWGMVADGITVTTKAQDYDTEVYVECEIKGAEA